MTDAPAAESLSPMKVLAALDYEAPFLIEKLVKDHIADTPEEAEALFAEVKRYLVIAALDSDKSWHMYSLRIDECWHQFILFTKQYTEFCKLHFGRYVPHAPSNSPDAGIAPKQRTTFREFNARYQELFQSPLPEIWVDARNVTLNRRVHNDRQDRLELRVDDGMIEILNKDGEPVAAVNDLAGEALGFIGRTGAFYVRELPGLDDEEKVALASMLVECRVLRLAS
ncbi:MAG: hypothetical protein AB7F09_11455 [Parvibaculaceae bacterium]